MKIDDAIKDLLSESIYNCKILPDDTKDTIIRQILLEMENISPQTWFNCKMIIWKNRYTNVSKENFFKCIDMIHLKELIQLQGGNL